MVVTRYEIDDRKKANTREPYNSVMIPFQNRMAASLPAPMLNRILWIGRRIGLMRSYLWPG